MKRLVLGAAAAGGAVFALRRLANYGRAMHGHCHEMMQDRCCGSSASCQPD